MARRAHRNTERRWHAAAGRGSSSRPGGARGFTYTEVIIAVAVLAVALVPALDALSTPPLAAAMHETRVARHFLLAGKMEELLAESFDALNGEASTPGSPSASAAYSDAGGTPNRRLVYVTAWDGDNADADNDPFTGTDTDILWLRVEIEGENLALEALTTR